MQRPGVAGWLHQPCMLCMQLLDGRRGEHALAQRHAVQAVGAAVREAADISEVDLHQLAGPHGPGQPGG